MPEHVCQALAAFHKLELGKNAGQVLVLSTPSCVTKVVIICSWTLSFIPIDTETDIVRDKSWFESWWEKNSL